MAVYTEVRKGVYFDSVTLMLYSGSLKELQGVAEAAVMMGTDHNKRLMADSGVLDAVTADSATPNDLIIGINAESGSVIESAKALLEELLQKKKRGSAEDAPAKTLAGAIDKLGGANMAVISLPGKFAAREAMKALKSGLNVLLFSDNVSVEEEIALKDYAVEQDLLLMGPDCGTAIIGGAALGFANVIRRGNIGLVAAAGTGLQEVSTLLHNYGCGVSEAVGTGGRDVKEAVGGRTMLQALKALNADPETEVIGIIGKPPAESVLNKIKELVSTFEKPVVVCLLGAPEGWAEGTKIIPAPTLHMAAAELATLAGAEGDLLPEAAITPEKGDAVGNIRALYTGGTLCAEAMVMAENLGIPVYSNIASNPEYKLSDPEKSVGSCFIDMGDDYFTDGMPHPMIDPRLRSARIIKELQDEDTKVLLLDCVLGYGSHDDPAGEIVAAIEKARALGCRDIPVVASVCGTDLDPQNRASQVEILKRAGVTVCESNAAAVSCAIAMARA